MLDGELRYRAGRRAGVLHAGDVLVVPPRTSHVFRLSPATATPASSWARRTRGLPSPRVAARLALEFRAEFFYLPHVPVAAQRAIGRALG